MSDTTRYEGREAVKEDLQHARREASELAGAAMDRGRERASEVKDRVADQAERIAEAVETTADELESNDGGMLSGYGRSVASMMRQLAGGLRERDVDAFATELADFARRNPAAFLAGSVALGFGLSRFLKASGGREHYEDYDGGFEDLERYEAESEFDGGIETRADTDDQDSSDEYAAFGSEGGRYPPSAEQRYDAPPRDADRGIGSAP